MASATATTVQRNLPLRVEIVRNKSIIAQFTGKFSNVSIATVVGRPS
jgi:hypothetical protein